MIDQEIRTRTSAAEARCIHKQTSNDERIAHDLQIMQSKKRKRRQGTDGGLSFNNFPALWTFTTSMRQKALPGAAC
jgi:hypothetical protein